MGLAVYEIVGTAGEWRVRHDGWRPCFCRAPTTPPQRNGTSARKPSWLTPLAIFAVAITVMPLPVAHFSASSQSARGPSRASCS